MNSLFTLRNVANKGRGFIALKTIKKGQVLFEERPIISALLEDKLGKYCSFCYNSFENRDTNHIISTKPENVQNELKFDTFCEECVEEGSKFLCLKHNGIRNMDYFINEKGNKYPLMARTILTNTLISTLDKQNTLFDGILGHLCYIENIKDSMNTEEYNNWSQFISNKLNISNNDIESIIPLDMYKRIISILHLNSISLTDSKTNEDIGTGLFGLGSMFNHSCDANVEITNEYELYSGFAGFKAVKNVEKDEELTICYGGLNDDYYTRQQFLYQFYGFICNCEKCIKEKPKSKGISVDKSDPI